MGKVKVGDALALEPRRDIYELIRRAPGTHLRGVERALGLPFGQVLYHLDFLERNGLIAVKKDGGFKRFFVTNVGRQEKPFLATFRHEVPRRIAILLLLRPGLSHRDILRYFDVSASTLSFHLTKMVESGILAREEHGNENHYRVVDDRTAAKALVLYRESYRDPAVDRFADLWLTVNHRAPEERQLALAADRELVARLRGADSVAAVAASVLNGSVEPASTP